MSNISNVDSRTSYSFAVLPSECHYAWADSSIKTFIQQATMRLIDSLKPWAEKAKQDAVMLWFAYRHPQTPIATKIISALAVIYALSPIDLIPDFIPVLGYLDELILLPCMVWLAMKFVPIDVKNECRQLAEEWIQTQQAKPIHRGGILLVVVVWMIVGLSLYGWLIGT
jgi:uncharacterized membrane protein YkvA (DUF1232 family)